MIWEGFCGENDWLVTRRHENLKLLDIFCFPVYINYLPSVAACQNLVMRT